MNTFNASKLLATTVSIALLAGCAVGPDFKRPEAPHAERYTAEKQTVASAADSVATQRVALGDSPGAQWWQVFHSPTLDQVVQHALAGNRTLAAATWSLAQAQEITNARSGALWPKVDLTGGVGRQKYGAQFLGPLPKPPPFNYFSVGATVSYTLDYTGGVGRAVEQQRALAEYHQHQSDAAGLAVTGNAITQALRISALNAQIATVEELLDRDRENLKLIELAFKAGSVSRLDVVSAQSQLASDATALPPLRQELSIARHALAVIVGAGPTESGLPDIDLAQLVLPDNLPVSIPSELAHRRPDILSAEAQLHAATAAVGIATSNLYPRSARQSTRCVPVQLTTNKRCSKHLAKLLIRWTRSITAPKSCKHKRMPKMLPASTSNSLARVIRKAMLMFYKFLMPNGVISKPVLVSCARKRSAISIQCNSF
jgi:NodT family efflux transporter outer membrane factor (OMF) lipoprotein